MKKILVEKTDGIAEVIDQLIAEPEGEIILVVPRGSVLVRTMSNFRLLKREADAAGKEVSIESVDDTALAFAKECGIEAVHPLWRGARSAGADTEGAVSDIIPKSRRGAPAAEVQVTAVKKKKAPEPEPEFESEDEEDPDAAVDEPAAVEEEEVEVEYEEQEEKQKEESSARRFFGERPFFSAKPQAHRPARHDYNEDEDGDNDRPRRRMGGRAWTVIVIILLLVVGAAYVASAFFNHANISIVFKKTPWAWQGQLTADKSVSSDDLAGGVIAGQVFTANKNITDTFKASGQDTVSLKANGMITIYNGYSTKTQELVATTRFLTPDGKIFRIVNNVTVPGATKASDGTLQPSSITVPIVADQPGPDYNIGPVAKLSIPGFKGTPEENGFWGTITASTTGGFTGERAVPTSADIAAAKASTSADLQASLQGGFTGTYPNNFKILDGATKTDIGTLTVNTTTDAQGNFTVFATATLSAIGFDESALKDALLAQAQATEASSSFADVNLNYSNVSANPAKGTVSFSLSVQSNLEPSFIPVDFEQQILGKSVTDARTAISALPQLSSASISVWPSWISTIPSDPSKVHMSVD